MTKYRTFTTNLGTFVIWANSRDEVGLRTEWRHNRDHSQYVGLDLSDVNSIVTINRVDYSVNLFLTRASLLLARVEEKHQPWRCKQLGSSTWAWDGYDTNVLSRKDDSTNHGSTSARDRFINEVAYKLAQFLDSNEGKAFLAEGQAVNDAETIKMLDANLAAVEEAAYQLLRIKGRLVTGLSVTEAERSFARYIRIENNLKKDR